MKRLSPSEIALVCAPLVLAAPALFVIMRRLKPPHDPNAKIVLSIAQKPTVASTLRSSVSLGWEATAKNSPQDGIEVRFSERIVASGHGNTQVVYSAPAAPSMSPTPWAAVVGNEANQQDDKYRVTRDFFAVPSELPAWAEKAELQCDVVAVPRSSYASGPDSPLTIQGLATLRGAAHVQKRFSIISNTSVLKLFQACFVEPVPEDFRHEADTCITIRFREGPWKIFRQVVAFDGKRGRVLWSEKTGDFSPYQAGKMTSIPDAVWSESLVLKLKKVPVSWGKITFSADAVFDPSLNAKRDIQWCDQATVEKFKSRGWLAFSRQVVVRP